MTPVQVTDQEGRLWTLKAAEDLPALPRGTCCVWTHQRGDTELMIASVVLPCPHVNFWYAVMEISGIKVGLLSDPYQDPTLWVYAWYPTSTPGRWSDELVEISVDAAVEMAKLAGSPNCDAVPYMHPDARLARLAKAGTQYVYARRRMLDAQARTEHPRRSRIWRQANEQVQRLAAGAERDGATPADLEELVAEVLDAAEEDPYALSREAVEDRAIDWALTLPPPGVPEADEGADDEAAAAELDRILSGA